MNQNSLGQLIPQKQNNDFEFTPNDMLAFLKRSYKFILFIGLLGLTASFGYLLITPKQYQATAQIQMAQIGAFNNNNKNSYDLTPLGMNIEDPSLLIARFSYPTSYNEDVARKCGLESEKDSLLSLSKSVKFSLPKNVANVVEIKIIGKSPEAALICLQEVFDLIKTTQAKIIFPYIEEAKIKLLDSQERLTKSKELVAKADRSGSAMGAAYLSTRDEIRFLFDEITVLRNVVATNKIRATRLVAPIFSNENPIAPKKAIVLMRGLFGGLFLGLLIAFGRQLIPSLKCNYR